MTSLNSSRHNREHIKKRIYMRERKKRKDKFEMIDDVTYNLYVLVDLTV